MSPKSWFVLALLVLGAWHVAHLAYQGSWGRPPLPHGDGPDYESIAFSLSVGDGFQFAWQTPQWRAPYLDDRENTYTQLDRIDWPGPTASRPPLYPAMIAVVYQWVPRGPYAFAVVRILSALLTAIAGALAVGFASAMANRLLLPSWCSNLAAVSTMGLAILDRTIRNYANDFLTEPLALFLTTCIAAVGMQLQRSDRRFGWLLLLAFLSSLLVLTRSITVFWLPGFAVLTACSCSGHRIRSAGIFLVTVVLLLSPWWIRNCLILERWMPLGGQGAASLRGGYCDEALNDFGNWHGDAEEQIQKRISQVPGSEGWTQAQREVELADGANRETWSWVTAHLADIPKLVGMRVQTHWGPYSGPSLIWRLAIVFGWLCFLCPPKKEGLWVVGLPIVSTLTVALLYETGGRFLVPLYAVLYLTAGIGVAWLAGRCWDRCKRL